MNSHQKAIGHLGCWYIQENLLQSYISAQSKKFTFKLA